MLNFNHVYYFHVTALEGSIKQAASRLGVTQPTVSEQLRMLERALGTPLFDRTASGLKLTQAGRVAFEHTSKMFEAGQRLVEALGTQEPARLSLRVGMSAAISRTIATSFLMPVFTVESCRPVIRTGDFNEQIRDLRAHDLDLVIGETEPLQAVRAGLEIVTLHRPTLVAIAPPTAEPSESWENLAIVEYRPSSAYSWEVDSFLRERGLRPTSIAELDDAFLMLEAVASGAAIAFVPWSVASQAIDAGRVQVLATLTPSSTGVYAVFHQTETSDLVRRAVERLARQAQGYGSKAPS